MRTNAGEYLHDNSYAVALCDIARTIRFYENNGESFGFVLICNAASMQSTAMKFDPVRSNAGRRLHGVSTTRPL